MKSYSIKIINEISAVLSNIDMQEYETVIGNVLLADRIFVVGAGRSGLALKSFAMRLMHLGEEVFVIGETTTPSTRKGDLIIGATGSGTTNEVVHACKAAHYIGSRVILFTANATLSNEYWVTHSLTIGATTKNQADTKVSVQPMGSLFEQSLLLLGDTMILDLMSRKGSTSSKMFNNHANTE